MVMNPRPDAHHADLWLPVNAPPARPGLIRGLILTPVAMVAIWVTIYGVMMI